MKRVAMYSLLGLAVCSLFLTPMATAKSGPRPTKIMGHGTINFLTLVGFDSGQISHGGLFSNEWLATPTSFVDNVLTADLDGTLTVANGDQLIWEGQNVTTFTDASHTVFTIELEITGGTGRFEGATGFLQIAGTGVGTFPVFDFSYVGTGELSY